MKKTVYFRSFEEKDADLIYRWMNDDDLKELSVGLNRRICMNESLEWVKARMYHQEYNVFWAICAKENDRMIGYMSLNNIHYINRSAEFGGLVIGEKEYQDGMAWIESYLFLLSYAFDQLGLNRVYGNNFIEHNSSNFIGSVFYFQQEGVLRQAFFKNGQFHDASIGALLREDYVLHKKNGDFELESVIRRMLDNIKKRRNNV